MSPSESGQACFAKATKAKDARTRVERACGSPPGCYRAFVRAGGTVFFQTDEGPPSRALLRSFRPLALQLRVNSRGWPAAFI